MSNIYILEPPTEGKVLLHTTVGEIDIELWSKEAPKACRNFVQLCMEGYYDGTIFHRIVKDFIAQGGDPTGTGTGGESIYGKPFKDEFHQRLKFNHRGLVAMANAGIDDNQSQFFFTLDRTDELDKKHTIFGKVAGNTIYNMIRLNEVDVGENERPIEPPKIRRTEILSNPFDDIVPRKSKKDLEKEENPKKKKVKSNSQATKNYKLLSFGEEAEEDEEETEVVTKELKIKSSHDALDDPKLSMLPAVDESEVNSEKQDPDRTLTQPKKPTKPKDVVIENEIHIETEAEKEEREKEEKRLARKMEMKKLKREITGKDKEEKVVDTIEKEEKEVVPTNDLMQQLMDERKAFLKRKKSETILKKGGSREEETLALLSGFATKLETIESDEEEEKEDNGEDEDEDELNDGSWMGHHLKFAEGNKDAKDANMKDDDWYDIYDPRNPINQRRRENSKKENSERKGNDSNMSGGREWDRGKR